MGRRVWGLKEESFIAGILSRCAVFLEVGRWDVYVSGKYWKLLEGAYLVL